MCFYETVQIYNRNSVIWQFSYSNQWCDYLSKCKYFTRILHFLPWKLQKDMGYFTEYKSMQLLRDIIYQLYNNSTVYEKACALINTYAFHILLRAYIAKLSICNGYDQNRSFHANISFLSPLILNQLFRNFKIMIVIIIMYPSFLLIASIFCISRLLSFFKPLRIY